MKFQEVCILLGNGQLYKQDRFLFGSSEWVGNIIADTYRRCTRAK